jgi:hypothetical protein
VILISTFLSHSSMCSLMGAIMISCLVFILDYSLVISLRSMPNWCNVSSTSSFLLIYLTIHLLISSSENSNESLKSVAHETFNTSSFYSNLFLDKSIVSSNKIGSSSSFLRSKSLKKRSPLLLFTTSNSFIISLKFFILFNQQELIYFIQMLEGRFCSFLCISLKLETLVKNVPIASL